MLSKDRQHLALQIRVIEANVNGTGHFSDHVAASGGHCTPHGATTLTPSFGYQADVDLVRQIEQN